MPARPVPEDQPDSTFGAKFLKNPKIVTSPID